MRFFIYPALVTIWVWTGFSFVLAQGNPEALNKTKKWLIYAFVTTFIVFILQAFLTAARGTVQKVLPASQTQSGAGTQDGRVAPKKGETGSACTTKSGSSGITGTDGDCYPSGRG